MEHLLKEFSTAYIRDYKGGKEIRTKNMEWSLDRAEKLIKKHNLSVEIFEKHPHLNSFSIREKK